MSKVLKKDIHGQPNGRASGFRALGFGVSLGVSRSLGLRVAGSMQPSNSNHALNPKGPLDLNTKLPKPSVTRWKKEFKEKKALESRLPGEQQGESREPSACMVFYQSFGLISHLLRGLDENPKPLPLNP